MEMNVLKHRASLSQEDHEANDKRSQKPASTAKLNANFIGVSFFLCLKHVFVAWWCELNPTAFPSNGGRVADCVRGAYSVRKTLIRNASRTKVRWPTLWSCEERGANLRPTRQHQRQNRSHTTIQGSGVPAALRPAHDDARGVRRYGGWWCTRQISQAGGRRGCQGIGGIRWRRCARRKKSNRHSHGRLERLEP